MSLVRVNILYMSVCGGILILTALCLRMLLKKRLPKATFSILWCVALLRLLTPFSVDAPFGILSVIQDRTAALQERLAAGQDYGTADGKDYQSVFPEGLHFGEMSGQDGEIGLNAGNGSVVGTEKVPAEKSPVKGGLAENGLYQGLWGLSLLRRIIITGGIVCAAVFSLLYLNCLRRFRTALPVENPFVERWLDGCRLYRKVRVMQSDRISSPLTYGFVRPVILLPKRLEQEDGRKLEYILQHELVHIRRFDGAWKLAMAAALCLHWFNPLVWVMYAFMNRDLELSCDEEVLRICGAEARKGYALTLIGMEEDRRLSAPLYSGFGKNAVEERVGEIMKYQKKTKAAVAVGAMLILAVVCVFATTSRAQEGSSEKDKNLSDSGAADVVLMDPPTGYFGEMDGTDGNAGSGTAAGTDSNADIETADGKEQPADGESGYILTYMKEGIPETEPARLMAGQGFSILLPEEGWTSFGPDGWMSELNNEVELWVANFNSADSDYRGFDREQIEEALQGQGYQESDGRYQMRQDTGRILSLEIRQTSDQDIWGIFYTYPEEAEEGWGVELRAIAQTFRAVRTELSGAVPEGEKTDVESEEAKMERQLREMYETQLVRELLTRLMQATDEKERHSILPYIAEGYEVELDFCLDRITGWKPGEIPVTIESDEKCSASIQVTTIESEADSNDYLAVELIKEGEDWKICSMGFEK